MTFKIISLTFLLFSACLSPAYAATITPSHVYAQAERIHADILSIKAHLKIKKKVRHEKIKVRFQPQHVWQRTYEILFKLSIFRRVQGYPSIAVSTLEPLERIQPKQVYDQTRRILTEVNLIKEELNIRTVTPAARQLKGKIPSDVYQLLSRISSEIDLINDQGFTPSHVFSQVIRLNDDIDTILHAFHTTDTSYPPTKNKNSQPKDAQQAGIKLLKTVTKIQRFLSIESTDFSDLRQNNILPADVYALIGLISAELQTIKFALDLQHERTPSDKFYDNKAPADVEQLILWCNNKLQQVNTTRF